MRRLPASLVSKGAYPCLAYFHRCVPSPHLFPKRSTLASHIFKEVHPASFVSKKTNLCLAYFPTKCALPLLLPKRSTLACTLSKGTRLASLDSRGIFTHLCFLLRSCLAPSPVSKEMQQAPLVSQEMDDPLAWFQTNVPIGGPVPHILFGRM